MIFVRVFLCRGFRELSEFEGERPPFAPDLPVEIRSPDDRDRNVARKVEIYLAYGSRLVLDVHPKRKTIVAHGELPGFRFDVTAFFARGNILRDA